MSTNVELDSKSICSTSTSIEGQVSSVCPTPQESIVSSNNYTVCNDNIVIPTDVGDLPSWLVTLISDKVSTAVAQFVTDMNVLYGNVLADNTIVTGFATDMLNAITAALDAVGAAKNQYQELINIEETIDGVIATRLTTINATLGANSATIYDLQLTSVTEGQALSIAANKITAELNGGAIGAAVTNVQTALATTTQSLASSIEALTAVIYDEESGVYANAEAIVDVYAQVGILENGLVAAKSEWKFDSLLEINGNYYETGFGLVSSGFDTPDQGVLFDSEFWVKADKFKVVGTDSLGNDVDNSIFTIDTTTGSVVVGLDHTEATRNVFKGDWLPNTPYYTGDVVYYNSSSYTALNSFTSGNTFEDDIPLNVWQLYGAVGRGFVLGIAFARFPGDADLSTITTPTGGSYSSPVPDSPVGVWSDGIPPTNPNGDAVWFITRKFYSDGNDDGNWSTPTVLVNTNDIKYVYSTSVSLPSIAGAGPDAPVGWSSDPGTNAIWAAVSKMSNGSWSTWATYRIKGEQGDPGGAGSRGASTLTYYSSISTSPASLSSSTVASYWNSAAPPELDNELAGDRLIVTTNSGTRTWQYTGSSWVLGSEFIVNGDAIVNGSITANLLNINGVGFDSSIGGEKAVVWADADSSKPSRYYGVFGRSLTSGGIGVYGQGTQYGMYCVGAFGIRGDTDSSGKIVTSGDEIGSTSITGKMYAKTVTGGVTSYGSTAANAAIAGVAGGLTYAGAFEGNVTVDGDTFVKGAIKAFSAGQSQTGATNSGTSFSSSYRFVSYNGSRLEGNTVFTGNVYQDSGTYYGFTGSHQGYLSEYNTAGEFGDILVDFEVVSNSDVSNAITKVRFSTTSTDRPIGVYLENLDVYPIVTRVNNESIPEGYIPVGFNAVGEGMLNVCGEGGDLQNGDLIQCSGISGKGMRQNKDDGTPDDVIRNITVAKVRGNHTFTSATEVKQVPCVYLCG